MSHLINQCGIVMETRWKNAHNDNFVYHFWPFHNGRRSPFNPFCLGMCDWTGCIGAKVKPPCQLNLPTTSKNEPHLPSCELFELANDETLETLSKGSKPVNTDRSTKRALKVFDLWCEERTEDFQKMRFLVIFLLLQILGWSTSTSGALVSRWGR